MATLQVGQRVEVLGKGVQGIVAYVGTTLFANGKWVGVILDEPKGKNNGIVDGKVYFQCKDNYGSFVRQSQLALLDESGNRIELASPSPSGSTATSPDDTPKTSAMARSRLSSSRQSLTGRSRGDSRSREDVTASMLPTPTQHPSDPTPKRASFIETGFVETLKPQFTPGQVLASPSASQSSLMTLSVRGPPPPDPAEMEALKSQVQDLTEKLETIRIKHKEKIHENDQLRLQLDQASEFKFKIMEAQAALKKELERARRERQEALEAREELQDMADTLEMATLDKEMAEEKVETLQIELEQARERVEELTLDLEIMKAEMSERAGDSSGEYSVSTYQMKQLEQQNTRLRDTLVRMRDLSAHEKHETQKLQRDLEAKRNETAELLKITEKLKNRVQELETQVTDLHEQVDAALGAEEMVEQLGLQKLTLEDKVKELEEAVADLEALQELNDQLQEGSRELEMDLREEVDMAHAATREALRQKEQVLESLADRELTIVKFRELVHKLQEQCMDLQQRLEKESNNKANVATVIPEMLDFKKMFAETKAHARAIDLELRRMEVQQSQQHVQYLAAYMPDSFMSRGGDNDAVLVLLLIPRLLWKCEILLSQVRDKFPAVQTVDRANLTSGHTVQQFSSRCFLAMHIHNLQAILRQFMYGLNTCSPETLLKVGAAHPEMAQQEKALDSYIELLKLDQLDENVNTDTLEKCVGYFNATHPLYLLASGETRVHQTNLVNDLGKALVAACESIRTDAAIVQVLLQTGKEPSDLLLLCQHLSSVCEVAIQHLKQIRRRVHTFDTSVLPVPQPDLTQCCQLAGRIAKVMREAAKSALSQATVAGETDAGAEVSKLLEAMTVIWERAFDDDSSGPIASLKQAATNISSHIAQLAQALLETEPSLPLEKEEKVPAPITLRAQQVKSELEETKALRSRLEARESDIRELKMALRGKQEELGEMAVRREFAEKRITNLTKEHELQVEKLQRKLDEAQQQMKRKEKEFEETMDHLQADIDSLESERGELKDKLKNYSKKVFIEGVKSSVSSPASGGMGQNVIIRESPILLNEIRALKAALKREQAEKSRLETDHYMNLLNKLEPLKVVKKVDDPVLTDLEKKVQALQKEAMHELVPSVVDISKRTPATVPSLEKHVPSNHILNERYRMKKFYEKVQALQSEVMSEVIRRKHGGKIETDLTVFPTPEMAKALHDSTPIVIGEIEITVPNAQNRGLGKPIPLLLDTNSLRQIQEKLLSIGQQL